MMAQTYKVSLVKIRCTKIFIALGTIYAKNSVYTARCMPFDPPRVNQKQKDHRDDWQLAY